MKTSHILAIALAIGAAVWLLSGQFGGETPATAAVEATAVPEAGAPLQVRVADSVAQPYTLQLAVTGRTAASRSSELRVETSGRIDEITATEGDYVEEGALLVQIAMDDRGDRLARAKALLEQRQIEADASAELVDGGWRAQTADAATRADLQSAMADLAEIRLDIARTSIKAPFSGVLDTLDVEIGDVVDDNMTIGTLFDLDPVIVVAAVSEREIGRLAVGQPGTARLITGQTIEGHLRFVGKIAEPSTRTFRIELEVANPDHTIPAGLTADISLPLATVPAHFVSPAVLGLADDGTLGVKIVDADNVVRFVPVTVVADAADGIWIAGLPDKVAIVTVGHDYVTDGQVVEPVHIEPLADTTTP